jgi:hypothetical protein
VLADEALPLSSLDRGTIEADARTLEATVTALKDQAARATGTERDEALARLRAAERQLAVATAKLAALSQSTH